MSQYKDIPQPTDQRNVSQNDILTNYRYLATPLGVAGGVPPGIIPVDHFATGDNVANPTDGFHKQISFQDRATPASLTNAINGQASSGIEYSRTDGAGQSQIRYLNSNIDAPVTYLRAAVYFTGSGVITGNAFNVGSVTQIGSGDYRLNFTVALPTINYMVFGQTDSNSNPPTPKTVTTFTRNLNNVRILISNSITGALVSPQFINIMVIGFF